MRFRWQLVVAGLVLVAGIAGGCASQGRQLPPTLINASVAINLAKEHVGASAVPQSAHAGSYAAVWGQSDPGVDPERLVWAVTFSDTFVICPPDGSPCFPPRSGTTTVLLDYGTGEFISSSTVAPAP